MSAEAASGNLWVPTDAATGEKPPFSFNGFHHIEMVVSNAKQVSDWYCLRMGFRKIAYKGLETGSRNLASHVVKNGKAVIVFTSPLNPTFGPPNGCGDHMMDIAVKGDSVKYVGLVCDNADLIHKTAVENGATSVQLPTELKDEHGSVIIAKIETYGKCIHTLVQNKDYDGVFLPGFAPVTKVDPIHELLPVSEIDFIDHIVGNQPAHKMRSACDWYYRCLKFHRFWSVDDKQIHTNYSSLRSEVVSDYDHTIKMPINEPAKGKRISQIQEYVNYHGGAGVQHVAFNCRDLLTTVKNLRARGMEFLSIPQTYYKLLRKRLERSPITVKEDLDVIENLQILVDFDDQGYLLQLFTKPLEDRPTLFFEFIQRANNEGFGVGNFKALFESIEAAQAERGNL